MKINKLQIGMCLLLAWAGASCEDAKLNVVDNSVYIAEAATNNSKKLTVDNTGGVATITVRAGAFYSKDVKVKIGTADEATLKAYNDRNGTEFVTLPADNFTLSESDVVIKQGQISAPTVTVNVKPLTEEQVNSGNKYIIPVSILAADETTTTTSNTMFYLVDQVIITKAPHFSESIPFKLTGDAIETMEWTLEYRTCVDQLPSSNSAQFGGAGWWGPKDTEIFLRWGDANVPGNRIMIKTQGAQFISNTVSKAGQWYHHAWVHDGKTVKLYINGVLDSQMESPGKISSLNNEFTVGCGFSPKSMSEWRFWRVARTQKQIQDNMFSVNPESEGLEVYLKMNEGEGSVLHDSAKKHAATGTISSAVEWRTIRSDEQ